MKVSWRDCKSYPIHGEAVEWALIGNRRSVLNKGLQPPAAASADGFVFFNRATLAPGKTLERHTGEFEEIYYLVQGSGMFQVSEREFSVAPGDAVYVPAGVEHGLRNSGRLEIEYLVAGAQAPHP